MKKEEDIRREKIIEYINSKEYKKMTAKQIAVIFNVPKEEYDKYEKLLNKLEQEGYIYYDDSKRICSIDNANMFVCKYEIRSRNFGFGRVIKNENTSDDIKDIYISRENSLDAFNSDIVLVKIISEESGKSKEGRIEKIIKRSDEPVVGVFEQGNNFGFVIPVNSAINDIYIPNKNTFGVNQKDRVLVKITKYPTLSRKAEGKIIDVIGHADDDDIDIKTTLAAYGLEETFSSKVLEEAESVSNIEPDLSKRIDFRKNRIYTIDSEDAKDLDDAVVVKLKENGNFILSVHIADVSNYVRPGSELDKEAIKRGTSVYIPNKVIPMLPKTLSNGICSLNAGEDRLTLAVDIEINKNGNIITSNIYKSIINVTKRMSYNKVQEVLDRSNKETLYEYVDYIEDVELMGTLAKILRAKREKDGTINFDIPETKVVLNDKYEVIDIEPYEINFSNKIIEEFMLIANQVIAETFHYLEAPFIYRIHETPDIDRVKDLNELLQTMNVSIKGVNNLHTRAFADCLELIKKENDERKLMVVSTLILRSLKLAKYNEVCLGHFGLGFEFYCHFTSPIRRYPDLFIHRIISEYINNDYVVSEKWLSKMYKLSREYAYSSSEREKVATEIERDFDDLYKVRYMKRHLGDVFEGVVSGVTKFGLYVKLDNTIEGMVTMQALEDDYYVFNEKTMNLIGERTGKIYELGQKVMVQVVRADDKLKQIDFIIVGDKDGATNQK